MEHNRDAMWAALTPEQRDIALMLECSYAQPGYEDMRAPDNWHSQISREMRKGRKNED